MTRILYWNIENFAYNKIREFSAKRTWDGQQKIDRKATDRLELIMTHVTRFTPDIFVVVEASSTAGNGPGSLISDNNGWLGCQTLLEELRNQTPDDWNLVPPLIVGTQGRAEAVAVFYKPSILNAAGTAVVGKRLFTGPNAWSAAGSGVSTDQAVQPDDYPDNTRDTCFSVRNRPIPGGAQHRGGQNESQCAARVSFNDTNGAAIDYGGLRSPYMVTFCETLNGPPVTVQRNLTLFAIHSPPYNPAAGNYLDALATVGNIAAARAANETRVIVGDFNINLFRQDDTMTGHYAGLTNLGYALQLAPDPANPPQPAQRTAYNGYFATHIKGIKNSMFWTTAGMTAPYPGYRYVGASLAERLYSIDNILVWGGAPAEFTVANTVVGVPLGVVNPAPGNAPLGIVQIPSQFTAAPVGWPAAVGPQYIAGFRQTYRGWRNYARIRSTSDHLALFVTV